MKKYTPPVIKQFGHKKLSLDYIDYITNYLDIKHVRIPSDIENEAKNIKTLEDNISNILKTFKKMSIKNNINKEITQLRKEINLLKADNKVKQDEALAKSNASFEEKLQKYKDSFSETFSDTSMMFSKHHSMIGEKSLGSFLREKNYDNLRGSLYGDDDNIEFISVVATTSSIQNSSAKLKPYVLFDDSYECDGFVIDEFIIGREFSLKRKAVRDLYNEYYNPYEGTTGYLSDGCFLSDTIHVIHKGKFCPVDTSKLSNQDKSDYNKALLLVAQVYAHMSSLAKKQEDETYKPIDKYKGITSDHEVFSNYCLLS